MTRLVKSNQKYRPFQFVFETSDLNQGDIVELTNGDMAMIVPGSYYYEVRSGPDDEGYQPCLNCFFRHGDCGQHICLDELIAIPFDNAIRAYLRCTRNRYLSVEDCQYLESYCYDVSKYTNHLD